ncbi:hypothetical protein HMPREF9944_00848 [Segatella maculosa OT 289]|uniref:Uncharacterized protein n=1 Tax=Segatella maculosa OT 289 TaxID=999422 RepID=H1HL04_9BACT|nr:hypothetical protein HMPREF9944_00848 [Segatella maculosa OT 289]
MHVFYHAIWLGSECRDARFVRPPKVNENECTRLVERTHGPCVPTYRKAYNLFARSVVNCQPKCERTHEPCVPTFPASCHIAHKNTYYLLSFLFHLSTACTIFA